jgi:hypothetical protein
MAAVRNARRFLRTCVHVYSGGTTQKKLVQFLPSSQQAVLTNSRLCSRFIEFCAKFYIHALFRTLEYTTNDTLLFSINASDLDDIGHAGTGRETRSVKSRRSATYGTREMNSVRKVFYRASYNRANTILTR